MTVEQIIRFLRPFFPKWRDDLTERYLQVFELPLKQSISGLSKGMRSKLMLLLTISRGADLLILDEPTDGLDPAAIEDVLRELVVLSASEEITIFFSSHQLSEVEQIADYVAIVEGGVILANDSLDDLKSSYRRLCITFDKTPSATVPWPSEVRHARQDGRTISILAKQNVDEIVAHARSLAGTSIEQFPVTLKEIFLDQVRSN
jgi:ABC-2 type transport system ATP-binding protein